jgi:UDP-N-acetylmuramate--alanine ligase
MKIYMIGIGGIGMSALAQLYVSRGYAVSGSDRTESPTIEMLLAQGVSITFDQSGSEVPTDADLVVYSDAVAEIDSERLKAKEYGILEASYFQALGKISKDMMTIAVAGTHGKTTTTAMLTKILLDADEKPTAIIGSIVKDFGSNFVAGRADVLVVEACEYRNHLLELSPKILVITNIEWDHTDWFKNKEDMLEVFRKAVMKVPQEGTIIANMQDELVRDVVRDAVATVVDYSEEAVGEIALPGEFNRMNARAAVAAARAHAPTLLQATADESLRNFKGTWRRFEYKGKNKQGADVYDDYAHHPTAISVTLAALRAKYPDKKILLAFHPHLYSRTRDLLEDFACSFKGADEVLIAPIYAAREVDDGTMSSDILAQKARECGVSAHALSLSEIESRLATSLDAYVIMTMGAGNIYTIADRITAL